MPQDETTAYAVAVVAREIIAGPHVRAACRRHLKDLKEGPKRGLSFDVEEAQRAIRFFATVLTVEVEEKGDDGVATSRAVPFVLQPWQAFIIGSLFGWKNSKGFRRFRRAYCEIGKGSGKSPMAAGIGHYMHGFIKKLRSEVYSAATDMDQANILFRDAVAMWERSPALQSRLGHKGENPVIELTHPKSGSFFKPISSDKKGKSGIRPMCALIDEIHEHPNNSVIEMLRAGTKGNQQALIFEITNSGYDRKSVCWHEHEYSVAVVHGDERLTQEETDTWFAYVCALDEGEEPFDDESCWIKVNPNLGISIQLDYIREQVAEAKGMPSKEGMVRRLNFCQWTQSESSAIPKKVWLACQAVDAKAFDPDELTKRDIPCFGALDLSRVRDLTAFTLTWMLENKKDQWRFASKTWFWTPRDTLRERAKQDMAPYEMWVQQGFMEAVPGPRIKYSWLADAIPKICARYHPQIVGGDQYGLEQLLDAMAEKGTEIPGLVVHPQGFNRRKIGEREDMKVDDSGAEELVLWMPDSINKLEACLLEERIAIDVNPVMTSCAAGVIYEENRTGHRMFNKAKATGRIDGMVSLAMSIGVATVQPVPVDIGEWLKEAVMA